MKIMKSRAKARLYSHSLPLSWDCISVKNWGVAISTNDFTLGPVNFDIKPGLVYGIMGRSGAGKSLLLKSLLGVLPENGTYISNATLTIRLKDGSNIMLSPSSMKSSEWITVRKHVFGYVPQDAHSSFNPILHLSQQLLHKTRNGHHLAEKSTDSRFAALGLDAIHGIFSRYPHQLSGGQAQRVSYLFGTINNPNVILADEPTSSLDPELVLNTSKIIRALVNDNQSSVILSSHDGTFTRKTCDVIVVLDAGQQVEIGSIEMIEAKPESNASKELFNAEREISIQEKLDSNSHEKNKKLEISLINIVKSYKQDFSNAPSTVLQIPTLTNIDSARVGVIGKSGSGKSTLGRIIAGLTKPSDGQVSINGLEIQYDNPRRFKYLANVVQYISQDPYTAFSPRKTMRHAMFEVFQQNHHKAGLNLTDFTSKMNYFMEAFHLDPRLMDKVPNNLSGGEKQRFTLIRALLCKPSLLILDEITASLDHVARLNILKTLKEITTNENVSYWMISHDPKVIRYMCDYIIWLEDGVVKQSAPIEKVELKI